MTAPPTRPKIYHITHVDNLSRIIAADSLLSDATIVAQGGPAAAIGMSTIKQRRIEILEVACHPGTKVGEYVPFYFCPRSIMLYVIYKANHPELAYKGGQDQIVHLEADLHDSIRWADEQGCRWAFSLSNAGAYYTQFRRRVTELDQLNWPAIAAMDFRAAEVKEPKQAEFLMYGSFPWQLVSRVGVRIPEVHGVAARAVRAANYRPPVEVHPDWYY